MLIIAAHLHGTETVSPYFPSRSGCPELFQEPVSLLAAEVSLGMNIFCRIRNVLPIKTYGIRWIVVVIMTTIIHNFKRNLWVNAGKLLHNKIISRHIGRTE